MHRRASWFGSSGSSAPRRRRLYTRERSLALSLYEGLTVTLLLAAPVVGMLLFGGTRVWSKAIIGLLALAGTGLAFLQPTQPSERYALGPPAFKIAWVILAYHLGWMLLAPLHYPARLEWLWLVSLFLPCWAWCRLGGREQRWKLVLGGLLLLVSITAWYALIQHAQGTRWVLHLPRPEGYGMRASGTYICPNHYAHLMVMMICVALALLWAPATGAVMKLIAVYSLVLFVPALFLTHSRSGWVGVAAGVATMLGVTLWRRRRRWVLPALALLGLGLGLMGVAGWYLSPLFRERLLSAPDGAGRLLFWRDTLALISDRPWFGHGPGSYRWVYPAYRQEFLHQGWLRFAHNEYLHAASDSGLVGLGLFLLAAAALAFTLLRMALKARRERDSVLIAGVLGAWAGSLSHAFFDFNLHVMANVQMLALLTGLAVGLAHTSGSIRPPLLSATAWRLRSLAVGLLVLVTAAGLLMSLGADYWLRRGDALRDRLRHEEALNAYRHAVAWDSAHWEPWLRRGHVYQHWTFWAREDERRARKGLQALDYYDQAALRNPLDSEIDYGRSRTLMALGRQDEALATLRALLERVPTDQFVMIQLGLQYRQLGRHQEAYEVFQQAARLGGADPVVRANLRWLRQRLRSRNNQ